MLNSTDRPESIDSRNSDGSDGAGKVSLPARGLGIVCLVVLLAVIALHSLSRLGGDSARKADAGAFGGTGMSGMPWFSADPRLDPEARNMLQQVQGTRIAVIRGSLERGIALYRERHGRNPESLDEILGPLKDKIPAWIRIDYDPETGAVTPSLVEGNGPAANQYKAAMEESRFAIEVVRRSIEQHQAALEGPPTGRMAFPEDWERMPPSPEGE